VRQCPYATLGFPVAGSQPVLVDFENSIFERSAYADNRGSVLDRDDTSQSLRSRVFELLNGRNPVAEAHCSALLGLVKSASPRPLVLVIGGGTVGSGAEALYNDPAVDIVGTDVFATKHTQLIADGHALPFRDGVFDAVWIQAVLEHVLEPEKVVAEIHRVLKPGGLVYADTPFMQQVHEGAYDFTRFTQSGHRWLFRRFEQIQSGTVGGPWVTLVWSIRYAIRSTGINTKLATILAVPFAWLRLFDGFAKGGKAADGASGIFFLGRKSDTTLTPKDMVAYYNASR
jgi:SAM-dependent methyltransferase